MLRSMRRLLYLIPLLMCTPPALAQEAGGSNCLAMLAGEVPSDPVQILNRLKTACAPLIDHKSCRAALAEPPEKAARAVATRCGGHLPEWLQKQLAQALVEPPERRGQAIADALNAMKARAQEVSVSQRIAALSIVLTRPLVRPVGATPLPPPDGAYVKVKISPDTIAVSVDDQAVPCGGAPACADTAALSSTLTELKARPELKLDGLLILEIDRKVLHARVVQVMDVARPIFPKMAISAGPPPQAEPK